jgi:hypothetical protein
MNFFKIILFITCLLSTYALDADEVMSDINTSKIFPRVINFTYDKTDYKLEGTGVTTYTKFFINVYSVAQYLQNPVYGARDYLYRESLDEKRAKALIFIYVIDMTSEDAQKNIRDEFKKSLKKDEYESLKEQIDKFVAYFDNNITTNEQVILIWLPDGTLLTSIGEQRKSAIQNPTFAKALWNIWLGPKAIVNRTYLIQNYKTD